MMKTMSGEMMRGADADKSWDDDADDEEMKVAVWGNNRQKGVVLKRWRLPAEKWLQLPVVVNHVTRLHPVCSQLLTGLKALNGPAALLETDVVNGRGSDVEGSNAQGQQRLNKLVALDQRGMRSN